MSDDRCVFCGKLWIIGGGEFHLYEEGAAHAGCLIKELRLQVEKLRNALRQVQEVAQEGLDGEHWL